MPQRSFLCTSQQSAGEWEALCLDLDIAVQGRSLPEVRSKLADAIAGYIEDAKAEEPRVRDRLLSRRAPLWTRLKVAFRLFTASISVNDGEGDQFEAHRLPCPV